MIATHIGNYYVLDIVISLLKEQLKLYPPRDLPLFVDKNVWLHWMETQRTGNHRQLPSKLPSNTIQVTKQVDVEDKN